MDEKPQTPAPGDGNRPGEVQGPGGPGQLVPMDLFKIVLTDAQKGELGISVANAITDPTAFTLAQAIPLLAQFATERLGSQHQASSTLAQAILVLSQLAAQLHAERQIRNKIRVADSGLLRRLGKGKG